jgi:phosphoenolpyruvate synthase/pyruvate phosphate dikinase
MGLFRYREGFALECKAMKRVREEMGLTNLVVMIPFCRRVNEAEKVLAEMAENGLKLGICGQAPSDFPEFAEFLVKEGINSISLNPDSIMKVTLLLVDAENF